MTKIAVMLPGCALVPWAPPHSCPGELQGTFPFSLLYATSHCSLTKPLQDLPYLQAHPSGFLAPLLMLGEIVFSWNPVWEVFDSRDPPASHFTFSGLGLPFPQMGPPQAPWYRGASLHCWEPPSPESTAFLSLQALQCNQPLLSWFLISLVSL